MSKDEADLHLMSQGMESGDDERELRGEGCLGWVKEEGAGEAPRFPARGHWAGGGHTQRWGYRRRRWGRNTELIPGCAGLEAFVGYSGGEVQVWTGGV